MRIISSLTRRSFLTRFSTLIGIAVVPVSGHAESRQPHLPEAEEIWTTRDGQPIRICDMSDDHLRNSIIYIAKRHGYHAGLLYTHEYLSQSPQDTCHFYDIMRREADRRHLTWI
jgi:hypothetical protein